MTTHSPRAGLTVPRALLIALCGLLSLALLMPAAGEAAKKKRKKDPQINVMTRNLFLGADLNPAIGAPDLQAAINGAGVILNEVDSTDFRVRAKLLAREIKRAKPHILGLQEVALWKDQEPSDLGAPPLGIGEPATNVRYNFLRLLRKELRRVDARYRVEVIQREFSAELPTNLDGDTSTGAAPFGADLDASLTMRDVIMVRRRSGIKVQRTDKGHFQTRYEPSVGGIVIPVDRGWTSIDARVRPTKRKRGARLRLVNTHLEAFGEPQIRAAQARELFAKGGPLRTKRQLILIGDINSGGKKDKIGLPWTKEGDELAFRALMDDFSMVNRGTRQTCCYPSVMRADIGTYRFDHTVDHVMVKPRIPQKNARVTGKNPNITRAGLVSSDHGGLVSRLVLRRR